MWIESHPRGARTGAVDRVAAACGVSRAAVGHWLRGFRAMPPEKCPIIERLTGVSCEELCPAVRWNRDGVGQVVGYVVAVN